MFVENSQVSIEEHQPIRLSIEGNENIMCMKIMEDLSGKIFHLPQDLFHMGWH